MVSMMIVSLEVHLVTTTLRGFDELSHSIVCCRLLSPSNIVIVTTMVSHPHPLCVCICPHKTNIFDKKDICFVIELICLNSRLIRFLFPRLYC